MESQKILVLKFRDFFKNSDMTMVSLTTNKYLKKVTTANFRLIYFFRITDHFMTRIEDFSEESLSRTIHYQTVQEPFHGNFRKFSVLF